jgi:hypothetical protein
MGLVDMAAVRSSLLVNSVAAAVPNVW